MIPASMERPELIRGSQVWDSLQYARWKAFLESLVTVWDDPENDVKIMKIHSCLVALEILVNQRLEKMKKENPTKYGEYLKSRVEYDEAKRFIQVPLQKKVEIIDRCAKWGKKLEPLFRHLRSAELVEIAAGEGVIERDQ